MDNRNDSIWFTILINRLTDKKEPKFVNRDKQYAPYVTPPCLAKPNQPFDKWMWS